MRLSNYRKIEATRSGPGMAFSGEWSFPGRLPGGTVRALLGIGLLLLAFSCSGVSKADLHHLEGYWEIREVEFPDGNNKEFPASPMVDYFSMQGRSGYRKKLQPRMDGTFETSDDALPLEVLEREGLWLLRYTGEEGDWEETLVDLGPQNLALRDPAGVVYRYVRYQPLTNTIPDGTQ
ncbi:hypothetical protein [Robiginitalea biformata]|nr:hypothetical protein [Robiginitalea biformata]